MEIALCILTGLLGLAAGYGFGLVAAIGRQRGEPARTPEQADPTLMRQYQNFIQFDGTGKGQKQIED